MATHRVGGEVDALCTRCRMTLAHTILAMVGSKLARVRCNTCGGDHAYRKEPGNRASRTSATPRERTERTVLSFEAQLQGKDVSKARNYNAKENFQVDEVVRHPTFGLGIVAAVREDKIEVSFKATQKVLIHGRAESAARPAYHPPAPSTDAPADKPTKD